MATPDDEFRELIKEVMLEVFAAQHETASDMDGDLHGTHHQWISAQIAREERRKAFWEAVAGKSVPAALWLVLSSLAAWIWSELTKHITFH
jgi:hypothetical protein